MRVLRKFIHKDVINIKEKEIYTRIAARSIAINGDKILLMFTKRYDDYSFPGGGVDEGEDTEIGMIRELKEETGAQNIKIIKKFGVYDELKPYNRNNYKAINMISHFYVCTVNETLGENKLENYELTNGMEAKWINIDDAIKHNAKVIREQPKNIGLYIDRELYMLELVKKELMTV